MFCGGCAFLDKPSGIAERQMHQNYGDEYAVVSG